MIPFTYFESFIYFWEKSQNIFNYFLARIQRSSSYRGALVVSIFRLGIADILCLLINSILNVA